MRHFCPSQGQKIGKNWTFWTFSNDKTSENKQTGNCNQLRPLKADAVRCRFWTGFPSCLIHSRDIDTVYQEHKKEKLSWVEQCDRPSYMIASSREQEEREREKFYCLGVTNHESIDDRPYTSQNEDILFFVAASVEISHFQWQVRALRAC